MRVLLINPPYKESTYISPPLGLAYIASILRENGHNLRIIDAPPLQYDPSDVKKEAGKVSPDLIGIGSMTATIKSAVKVAEVLKSTLEVPVVMGGVHPTIMPEETLKNVDYVDIIVRGEGEETFLELVNSLENGQKLDGIKGISYKENGKIFHNPDRPLIKNLDLLPFPARDLLPMGRYRQHLGHPTSFATMITSRGCPFNCIYCTKTMFGRLYRFRSAGNVLQEMKEIIDRYHVKEIDFYDDMFTANRKRVIELCDAMIKERIDIQWKCEARVDLIDKELLMKMKEAGCYLIAYGVESGYQHLLEVLEKKITLEHIRKAFKLTREIGIETLAYLMIGIPGETKETIQKTLELAIELDPDYAQIGIATPYPKTRLYEMAKASGYLLEDDWSKYAYVGDAATPVMRTEDLTQEDLKFELKRMIKKFYLRPRYILKQLCNLTSFHGVQRNISGLKSVLKWIK